VLSSPEDYGLREEETLAFEVTDAPPAGFDAFWATMREEIATLPSTWRGTVDGPIGEVIMQSVRGVRVVARLSMPSPRPRGVVIALHGHDAPAVFSEEIEPWTEVGLATLQLRVRGYPPSTMDIDDLRTDWILTKLGVTDSWIVRGAVADVIQAYRCARRHFGPQMPLSLHGESLGAGLAIIAAAQLGAMGDEPLRMVLAHPDLGAWRWRSGRHCGGPGGRVNEMLITMRQEGREILESMLLYDTVHHAPQVRCPTLCKLAGRDDFVPAPAAAAVFNAIATDRKWPYRTAFGHYDGGLADSRRHAFFAQINARFVDPAGEPEELFHRGGGEG
jgi:cephalosporin-C deacetylase-like acetyl esterase